MYWINSYEGKSRLYGTSWLAARLLALDRHIAGRWEVDTYYRFRHYGWPLYFRHSRISQVQNTSIQSSTPVDDLLPQRRKLQ